MINLSNARFVTIAEGHANKVQFADGTYWEEYAPMLASSNTWYKGAPARNTFTSITITTNYIPTGNEDESWNADSENTGSIKAYRTGTNLVLAITDGSRFLYANPNSFLAFGGNSASTRWSKVTKFTGSNLINTSKVTSMERMFDGLFLLENIDVSRFDTSSVTNMDMVFNNCELLKEIDVGKWNTSNVTTMYAMFADCTKIKKLDMSNWDVRKVENANSLVYDCYELEEINLNNCDWCGITNIGMSFYRCYALKEVKLKRSGNAHQNNTVVFQAVLSTCKALTSFDASGFSTEGASDLTYFFEHCTNLEFIRFRNLDFSKCGKYGYSSFFSGSSKIKRVDFNGIVTTVSGGNINIFPTNTEHKIEVYVGSEEEKTFVKNYLAYNATNVVIYIGDMPHISIS